MTGHKLWWLFIFSLLLFGVNGSQEAEAPYVVESSYEADSSYGEGSDFVVVLGGNHWNATNASGCDTDEDDRAPNTLPNILNATKCNETDNLSPGGGEYASLEGKLNTQNERFQFDGITPDITSGTVVFDGYLRVEDRIDTSLRMVIATQDGGGTWDFPQVYDVWNNPNHYFRLLCSGTGSTSTTSVDLDTWYKYRVEWHHNAVGPGNCAGTNHSGDPLQGCEQCGCLFIDDVEVASCTSSTPHDEITGFHLNSVSGEADIDFDDNYMCKGVPPTDVMCGEVAPSFANVLAGQHWNDTGTDCSTDESEESPNVLPDLFSTNADCNASAVAGYEGTEYVLLPGDTSGAFERVRFDEKFTPVTSGPLITDWMFYVSSWGSATSGAVYQTLYGTGNSTYPIISLRKSPQNINLNCGGTVDWSSATYSLLTWHNFRLEWHVTDGPGNCIDLDANCEECGCIYLDGVQIAECDGSGSVPSSGGQWLAPTGDSFDILIDRTYWCNELPGDGLLCGDGVSGVAD